MGSVARVTSAAEGLPRRRFTVAEVEAMVAAGVMEEDERVELIGGELVPMSPKGIPHEVLKKALLRGWYRAAPDDVDLVPETTFRLSEDTYLEPDILVYPRTSGLRGLTGLSSDAKCNTPRRFDIGKVVQDLKECCHAILFASLGRRKRPDRRFAGRGAVDGSHCPGARSGENHRLQGAAAERAPLRRVFAASRRRRLSIAQAA